MRRLVAILSTLALIASLTVSSVAATPPRGQSRVIANIVMAPYGTTDAVGRVTADVHAPANSADVPGDYSFDGNAANDLKHARGVVQRASFWPWVNDVTGAKANFAFIEGVQCLYWASQDPKCTDASWAFIDYLDPRIPDVQVSCWWDGGVRPAEWTGTWNSCDSRFTPTAHQDWYDVVQGSLVVHLAP